MTGLLLCLSSIIFSPTYLFIVRKKIQYHVSFYCIIWLTKQLYSRGKRYAHIVF